MKGWDKYEADQSVLKQHCYKLVAGQNVDFFGQMVVVCKSLLAACIPCGAVHHLWEDDQDYRFVVLCNVDLRYDNITGLKVRLVFVCSTAVISVLRMLSLGIY